MTYDPQASWRGRAAVVRYGQGGHEHEFCINIAGFSLDSYIPASLAEALAAALEPRLSRLLLNRGSRLELVTGVEDQPELERALAAIGLEVVAESDYPW